MSGTEPEQQVSKADFDKLVRRLEQLVESQEELKAATTDRGRAAARSDVVDHEREFRRLARQHGLDDDDIAQAVRSKRKRELRELLDEIRDEGGGHPHPEPDDPDDDDDQDDDQDDGDDPDPDTVVSLKDAAAKRGKGRRVKAPPPPPEDEPPGEGAGDSGVKTWASRVFGG